MATEILSGSFPSGYTLSAGAGVLATSTAATIGNSNSIHGGYGDADPGGGLIKQRVARPGRVGRVVSG